MELPLAVVFHGVVAILIILAVLLIVISGVVTLIKLTARGAKTVAEKAADHTDHRTQA